MLTCLKFTMYNVQSSHQSPQILTYIERFGVPNVPYFCWVSSRSLSAARRCRRARCRLLADRRFFRLFYEPYLVSHSAVLSVSVPNLLSVSVPNLLSVSLAASGLSSVSVAHDHRTLLSAAGLLIPIVRAQPSTVCIPLNHFPKTRLNARNFLHRCYSLLFARALCSRTLSSCKS